MPSLKRHIPNALTCCNLLSGCVATVFALQGSFAAAMAAVVTGAVFDFFDGFAARLLHVASPIGKELDSLADDVTFGVAPAAMAFALLSETELPFAGATARLVVPYLAFLIAAFSALRLAKFNLDTRQTHTFIGLPTPANALFWSALAVGCGDTLAASPYGFYVIAVLAALSCYLLVAEIPMFALKFTSYGWAANRIRYSFLLASIVLLVILGWTGFSAVIVLYVVLSILTGRRAQGNHPKTDKA